MALHSKVHVWWTDRWAVQFVGLPAMSETQLGVHIEFKRPLLDVFIGSYTIAIGKHPVLTDPRTAQRHSCRGMRIDRSAYEAAVL